MVTSRFFNWVAMSIMISRTPFTPVSLKVENSIRRVLLRAFIDLAN